MKRVSNFLTLDVEEWFDAEIPRRKLKAEPDPNTAIEKQVDLYIELCERLNIKSTCFVVGKLAEKKPQIVKKLAAAGHEIASHSYAHKLVYSMTREEFREDLHRSVNILQELTGEKVSGFRAPSWSVNAEIAKWFYQTLEAEGIIYSSSVYPARTFLYGMPEAPMGIHIPEGTSIIEIPQQLLDLGILKTGVAGGTYLRLLPAFFVRKFIKTRNQQGKNVFIYLHPWELLYQKYPVDLSVTEGLIQYFGVKHNLKKVESVCKPIQGSFQRMNEYIAESH